MDDDLDSIIELLNQQEYSNIIALKKGSLSAPGTQIKDHHEEAIIGMSRPLTTNVEEEKEGLATTLNNSNVLSDTKLIT